MATTECTVNDDERSTTVQGNKSQGEWVNWNPGRLCEQARHIDGQATGVVRRQLRSRFATGHQQGCANLVHTLPDALGIEMGRYLLQPIIARYE